MRDAPQIGLAKLHFWGLAARIVLIVDLVASTLLFGGTIVQMFGLLSRHSLLIFSGIAAISWLLTSLLAVPIVSAWIYRAHANLRVFGAEGLNYSPGWAVGSFFIPLVNFVVPFRAMRELCNRSFGEPEYHADSDVSDVSAWWTTFIVHLLIVSYFVAVGVIATTVRVFVTTPPFAVMGLSAFASLLWLLANIFLLPIIASVSAAQQSNPGVSAVFA